MTCVVMCVQMYECIFVYMHTGLCTSYMKGPCVGA